MSSEILPVGPNPEEIESSILKVVKEYEEDDRSSHEVISQECRKYELYWQNIQDIIWDSSSRDWSQLLEFFSIIRILT